MIAEALPEQGYASYRKTLQQLVGIPFSANDLEIHTLITHGFPASTLLDLVAAGLIPVPQRNQIISLRALKGRAQKGQLLNSLESDRLFTYAHIFSMSKAVFGCSDKALRWLHKPKARLIGKTPAQMLSTICGLSQVELMLMQITEGYAF
ncbi:antitoxin Xre/MbcA/ParS toxin-binding domain-containing protein [Pseudomonas sp. GW101-3H06]|uniref:antitoxin Xre/MbcA/ParS toxin-binding domain-containing protein n=1 Tax=Pseudomonas sp. GW101-3H06 TaxID=2751347 RepID=UPI001A910418|nr:antitoxin Xre/MbcA/ParS toxin-binding domain-containing protein [Pseudomonas sp. GW101-3H06]